MKRPALILAGIAALAFTSCGGEDQSALTPQNVTVYTIQPMEVPIYGEFVGQIYGKKDIPIRARVEGFLEGIHFQEGSEVRQGQLLYSVESQPYEADVAAKMSRVAEAKTVLAKTESDLGRIRPLAEENAVSQSDLDGAVAQYEAAVAGVAAAQANLDASKIQLSYTHILSPIRGIIGRTKAKVGEFVGRSPNPVILNEVSQIDEILVQFFITETQYLMFARQFITARDEEPGARRRKVEQKLELILADGSLYNQQGVIDFIDRGVDPTTGSILIQASFPNPQGLIRPGQFGRVRAMITKIHDGIVVPQRSVSELQGRFRVLVVTDDNTVELRDVKAGPTYKNFWLITEGLSPGERVVVDGLQKARPGSTVSPSPSDITLITNGE
jgi:membrane fusion protein (multidrug efflux system)